MKKPGEERRIAKMAPARSVTDPLPPVRNGRVFYKRIQHEPSIVRASTEDGTGKTWAMTGETSADAYTALLYALEREAGRGNEPVKILLGVLEKGPRRPKKRSGPAQGGLL